MQESADSGLRAVKAGDDWGCGEENSANPVETQYVEKINTDADGVITITAQNIKATDVDGQTVILTPYADTAGNTPMTANDYVSPNNIPVKAWICTFSGDAKYMPASCR
ncbi:pilin [Pseudomonas sp. Z8(2022)]|nr:pilin [Pseudomonas sp. Z8(2022)]